jgi:hypothetical protein
MRIFFIVVVAVHGLIHLMGFAKAFGFAELPQLTQPISRPMGLLWLAAALLALATVGALFLAPRAWWVVGALALAASQVVIVTSWTDARFGTVANLVLLAGVAYGFAARGPWSLHAEFDRDLARASGVAAPQVLTEADLAPLPEPVRRYVRRAGVVGRPRVRDFHATWTGRIRSDANSAWMAFTAEQLNTLDVPRRFFMMDATSKGLPLDVLHAFDEDGATMRVRLLSVVPVVDAKGAEMTRAETVTLFNDLCVLAPGALVAPSIAWETVDEHTARARFTRGADTIRAELRFNDAGDLVDFDSDDRLALSSDGRVSTPRKWTTPLRDYAEVGPARVATRGDAMWHPASGRFVYGEFKLTSLAYNVGR